MKRTIQARLSAMMFPKFFVWSAWYTTVAVTMTAHGMEGLTPLSHGGGGASSHELRK